MKLRQKKLERFTRSNAELCDGLRIKILSEKTEKSRGSSAHQEPALACRPFRANVILLYRHTL